MPLHSNKFGSTVREQRETLGKSLREVSEASGVDLSLLSKWERGERRPTEADASKLASALNLEVRALRVEWLTDTILSAAGDREQALEALRAATAYVEQTPLDQNTISQTTRQLAALLRQITVIRRAWLFGSFARGDARRGSDIDLMVEYTPDSHVSYIDQFAIAETLQQALGIKVDIVERGMLQDFAEASARNDLKLIYE
ncbi:MAG: helix-turn-helix domain-containing protein [Candidatus Kapabacteria bacterium]|nr:helix-turn-helix domain-containing protein [Candidatus Kapabacteria bacterium]